MTQIPKPTVKLLYNGKDCTSDFSKYLNQLTFQDFEDEQSDEITLNLNNHDGYFSELWYPNKGDKLTCTIIYGTDIFECGTLTIDNNHFDYGISGDFVEIKALATSTNQPVRSNKVRNWSGKTLNTVASEMGKSHGFKVLGAEDTNIGTIVQKNEADLTFLKRISREFGYIFNLKDNLLTFIKVDELINQESLFTLQKTDINNLSLDDTIAKMYGKVKVSYLNSKTKRLQTYTAEGSGQISDTYTIHKRFNSLKEAEIAAKAALKMSHKEVKGSISPKLPINNFIAGVNFDIVGIGKHLGKYHIISSKRTVSASGYKVEGEMEKCTSKE